MNYKLMLKSLDKKVGEPSSTRRYSLPEMISESYKSFYACEDGTNMKRLAEAHLQDVRENPKDLDRLSLQLSQIKEALQMTESGKMRDSQLVERKRPRRLKESVEDKRKALIDLYKSNPGEFNEIMNDHSPFYIDDVNDIKNPDVSDEEIEELYNDMEEEGYFKSSGRKSLSVGPYSNDTGFESDGNGGFVKYYDNGKVADIYLDSNRERRVSAFLYASEEDYNEGDSYEQKMFQSTDQAIDWCDKQLSMNESRRVRGKRLKESKITDFIPEDKLRSEFSKHDLEILEIKDGNYVRVKTSYGTELLFKVIKNDDGEFEVMNPNYKHEFVIGESCSECSEDINEDEDPELTDEEVDELAKHLDSIRKARKNPAPQKKEMTEESAPRKGIKCTTHKMREESAPKEKMKESPRKGIKCTTHESKRVTEAKEEKQFTILKDRKGKTSETTGTLEELKQKFSYTLEKGYSYQNEKGNKKIDKNPKTIKSLIKNLNNAENNAAANGYSDTSYSLKESKSLKEDSSYYKFLSEVEYALQKLYDKWSDYMDDEQFAQALTEAMDKVFSTVDESKKVTESYKGLESFSKNSSSKAFYKTFKKMHESLKEGKALTRQESMNLYKAANSAMTQLSVELEHNPKFLKTFNECTTLLSADVAKLLESMKNGKAPSKKTMKSLAKFSEALLNEAEEEDEDDIDVEDTSAEGEDFVGDDEGDVKSEEEEDFDQEYADKREEVYQELVDKHAESEDPGVQDKLEQERVEVAVLKGEDPDEYGKEDSEEPEDDETPEEEETPDDEVTDDELEELKKHLKEMRAAKKKGI